MALEALVLPLLLLFVSGSGSAATGPSVLDSQPSAVASALPPATWSWPVSGAVIRGFDPPTSPFGAGHRGIDIAVPLGTPIVAPEAGTVSFAGQVAGELFVTIDHGGALFSTYSWLSTTSVRRGDVVTRGQQVGSTGTGHSGSAVPNVHFGMKLDGRYVDPLAYLSPLGVQDLIRLVPVSA